MATIDILARARIEKVGKHIRAQLAKMRQHKLVLSAMQMKPARNPAFDPMLGELQHLRLRFAFMLRKMRNEQALGLGEDRALDAAQCILDDALEMIDLLIWFGAEIPADVNTDTALSGDRTGSF
jgi:hypothetical protein